MIQASRKIKYIDGVNHIHINTNGDSLLSFSIIFRDKNATDKRLRSMSLLQIGLVFSLELAHDIPDIFTLEPLVITMKENLNIDNILIGKNLEEQHQILVDHLKMAIEQQ